MNNSTTSNAQQDGLPAKILRRLRDPGLIACDVRKAINRIRNPRVVRVKGVRIPLGPHISPLIRPYLYSGAYEQHEASVLLRKIRREDVVLELGGGIGFMSALCARVVPDSHIHVYEANPDLEGPINDLYRLNGVSPRLNMVALGPEAGEMQFFVGEDFWDSSTLRDNTLQVSRTLKVPVRSFREEVNRLDPRPNFLIIDIEGGEFDFFSKVDLSGFTKILAEVHEPVLGRARLDEMLAMLKVKGFRLDEKSSSAHIWYLER